jgi:thiamine-monophosphate kinase
LHALERKADAPELVRAHYHLIPRFPEGQWFSARPEVHAMIDVSDGLVQDAGHLAEAAHLGIDIDPTSLPVDPSLAAYCTERGLDPYDFILAGGEDYELAFAVAGEQSRDLVNAFRQQFHTGISVVGTFTDAWRGVRIAGNPPSRKGFDHFSQP